MRKIASTTLPGPASASAAVDTTHPAVKIASSRFLAARRSAYAPMLGMVNITIAYETLSAAVHAKVAHSALPAMPPTK